MVDGEWHFELWAKAQTAGDKLYVAFRRVGETQFMNKPFTLTTEWQKLEHTFSVTDGRDALNAARNADGTSNPLAFELRGVERCARFLISILYAARYH